MSSEEPTGAEIVSRLPMLLQPEHEPTPTLVGTPHPDGSGAMLYPIKIGPDRWAIEERPGPAERVARHEFESVRGFVRWVQRWAPVPSACQVLANVPTSLERPDAEGHGEIPRGMLEAILDPRDWQGDRVTCAVALDPGFRAWLRATWGRGLSQRELFNLVREAGDLLVGEHTRTVLLGELAALRVSANSDLEVDLAPNGRTRIHGVRGGTQVDRELPEEVRIRTPFYLDAGGDAFELRVVLSVEAGPAGIVARLSMPGLDRVLAAANAALCEHVERELGQPFLVAQGAAKSVPVPELGRRLSAGDVDDRVDPPSDGQAANES